MIFINKNSTYQLLLNWILACLLLEFLESVLFQSILPKHSMYFKYVVDAFLIYLCKTIFPDLVDKVSNVRHDRIYLWSINNTLLFLDMLNCTGNDLKLSIYHKSINKNVLINFYSHDNNKFIIYNFYFKFRIICKVLLKFISKKILIKDASNWFWNKFWFSILRKINY